MKVVEEAKEKMKKTSGKANKEKVLNVAPGQALGYGLQYTRLTSLLLDAPEGTFCSLEVFDDVAEQSTSGDVRLSQTKSTLGGNPVSNKSVELWKSLDNWVKAVKAGLFDPEKTQFELYISKKVSGEIINAFSGANTNADAKKAVAFARELLWGAAPHYPIRSSLSSEIALHVNAVLEADDCYLLPILRNLRLECGSGSPVSDLQAKVKRMPVSPTKVDEILKQICGWVKVEVDRLLEARQPAVLSRDKFFAEFTSYVRKTDREQILVSLAPEPSRQEKHAELPNVYVQQLDLIDLTFEEKLEAISDFLRACWDRTAWAQKGHVHQSSFNELDAGLNKSWRNIKRRIEVESKAASEVEQGRVLYSDCMEHTSPLQGMDTPAHFVPGCFHRLADEQDLGWHPKYRDLLSSGSKKKTA